MELIIYVLIGLVIISIVIYSRKPKENEQKPSTTLKKEDIKPNNSNVVELQANLEVQIVDKEEENKNVEDDNLQVELANFDMEEDDYSSDKEYMKYMREGFSEDVSDEMLKALIDLLHSGEGYYGFREKIKGLLPPDFYYRFYDKDKDVSFKGLKSALNVMKVITKPNYVCSGYSENSFYYFDNEEDIDARYFTRVETSREHYQSYMLTLNLNDMKKILPFKVRKKDDYVNGILDSVDITEVVEKLSIPKMITVETTDEFDQISDSIKGYNELINPNLYTMFNTLLKKHYKYRDYKQMKGTVDFFPKIEISGNVEYCCENCRRKMKIISVNKLQLRDLPPYSDCVNDAEPCSIYTELKMEDE